jgi:hypothetical protein
VKSFVGHEARLRKLEAAANPPGTKIRISNPFPDGKPEPATVVGRCGGCDVYGSQSSQSILDRDLPDGYQRMPDGTIKASKSSAESQ